MSPLSRLANGFSGKRGARLGIGWAALFALLVATPQIAAAEDETDDTAKLEIVGSLWCDTVDQLETVLKAHYNDKIPLPSAMAEINRFSPEACVFARAIIEPGSEVKRLTAGDTVMSLRSARVRGIMRGGYALMISPQTWYFVHILAELVPL